MNHDSAMPHPFLRRVAIKDFKSIAACDVHLRRLTVLVGRNGAGKSNFLDSLHFVVDALRTSLDHAIKLRGGVEGIQRRSAIRRDSFAIQLELSLSGDYQATYGFEIATNLPRGTFVVRREHLITYHDEVSVNRFVREGSRVIDAAIAVSPHSIFPPVLKDRLYLVNAAGLPDFRPVYDALLAMGFYNFNPEAMKGVHSPDSGEILQSDGANIASVLARLSPGESSLERIMVYLRSIVPDIEGVRREQLGPKETLVFRQRIAGNKRSWFYASSVSDGTLRALGALVAVAQTAGPWEPVRVVGIEEPETALHPAAAGALMDALREASSHTQVIVTSHSPELVDQVDVERDTLLVVASTGGVSRLSHADAASREAIRRHLYTPGDLLRMDQLQPSDADLPLTEEFDPLALAPLPE